MCPQGQRTGDGATDQSHGDEAKENGMKELHIGHKGLPILARYFSDLGEAYGEARQRSMMRRYECGFDWAGKPILKYRAGTSSPARACGHSLAASAIAALQGLVEASDQMIFIEGLAQEAECASRQGARPETFVRKSRDKNYRQAMALGNQVPMHLNSAQTRHLHVRNDTGSVMPLG
jgi:hypothetical protein